MKTKTVNTAEEKTVTGIGVLNTLSIEAGRVLDSSLAQMVPDKNNNDSIVFQVESVEVYGQNGSKEATIRKLIFKPDTQRITLGYLKKFRDMIDDLSKFDIRSWNTAVRITRVEDNKIYCELLHKRFVLATINKKLKQIYSGN